MGTYGLRSCTSVIVHRVPPLVLCGFLDMVINDLCDDFVLIR